VATISIHRAVKLPAIPPLYGTEKQMNAAKVIYLHYFVAGCDWWITELDPDEMLAFGYACLGDPIMAEWGYVDLKEVEPIVIHIGQLPLVVERDLNWVPRRVSERDLSGRG
jgi:Protein of unknown function (DUF2958)